MLVSRLVDTPTQYRKSLNGPARVALFGSSLALVFAGAALAGAAIDPDPGTEESGGHGDGGGLRLVLDERSRAAGTEPLRFRIVDEDGATLRDFDVEHTRRMHVIVARRDLSGFQHLHPEQTADGGWQVQLDLKAAGGYRVFADFGSRGESHALGADLRVDGAYEPLPLPHPESTATTAAGHEVRMDADGGEVRFTVFEDGRRVRDIEPYLGARGHLVALREGDLAYLHVHPQSRATVGSDIRFGVEYPSKGRYRLFLQFKLDGEVHTAAFTREVGEKHGH
jgi:hypothetical protein